MEECTKQSILGGMCKKHYDEVNGVVKQRVVRGVKKLVMPKEGGCDGVNDDDTNGGGGRKKRGSHQRGLSIFQDNDLMETIINNGSPQAEDDGLRGLSIDTPI